MKTLTPIFLFLTFCILIATRDTLIDSLSIKDAKSSLFLLFVFCASASIYSWIMEAISTRKLSYLAIYRSSSPEQRRTFAKLSLATLAVYGITVYGIFAVSPGIINFIEYGIMPAMTLFIVSKRSDEDIKTYQWAATLVGLVGVTFFVLIPDKAGTLPHGIEWFFWVVLFALSAYLTSLCSFYQSQLVKNKLTPHAVLLYRFPLAAVVCGVACLYLRVDINWQMLPKLLVISLTTVFLPLWLLGYAFMREALGRFSIYLLFIPVFTVLIGAFCHTERILIYRTPLFVSGSVTILLSFLLFEKETIKKIVKVK